MVSAWQAAGQARRSLAYAEQLALLSRVLELWEQVPDAARRVGAGHLDLRAGDQLVADGVVRGSVSLQADESLLTGESEPVDKRAGDQLLSGSFVVAGSGGHQATGMGAEAYARRRGDRARGTRPFTDGIAAPGERLVRGHGARQATRPRGATSRWWLRARKSRPSAARRVLSSTVRHLLGSHGGEWPASSPYVSLPVPARS